MELTVLTAISPIDGRYRKTTEPLDNYFSEFALFKFDVAGIELSTGTTCQNKLEDSRSYVVDSLGNDCGASSLRISMGRYTKKSHIEKFLKVLSKVINAHPLEG